MKQYKRLLAAGLMVVMIASLTGCATNNKTDETVAENIESVTETTDASTTGTADAGVVHIATKPMTEQFILGEMLSMLIEQAGYKTEITKAWVVEPIIFSLPWRAVSLIFIRSTLPADGCWC